MKKKRDNLSKAARERKYYTPRQPRNRWEKAVVFCAKDILLYRLFWLPYLLSWVLPAQWAYFGQTGTVVGLATCFILFFMSVLKTERFITQVTYKRDDHTITHLTLRHLGWGIAITLAVIVFNGVMI